MDKRRLTSAFSRHVAYRVVSPVAGRVPWLALLETRGRVSGRPHRVPVGDGLRGAVFWIVAEYGTRSDYVKNIRRDPRVRVRTHGSWRTGVATPLPEDDPIARQRSLRLGANALLVRLVGTALLTVRVDLDP